MVNLGSFEDLDRGGILKSRARMRQFSSLWNGLAKSLYAGKGRTRKKEGGREAAEELAREAKRNDMVLRSSGTVRGEGSKSFASAFSQRGEKGSNQDCSIVWEVVN